MKFTASLATGLAICFSLSLPAYSEDYDCYAVNFRNAKDNNSVRLDGKLSSAIALIIASIPDMKIEEVVIDTSTATKWEKGAHEAFDRDIVPVFNRWVGLPGFAAIVDAKSKRVIGCVNSTFSATEMAEKIRQMCSTAVGNAYLSRANYEFVPNQSYIIKASINSRTTRCPAPHNVAPAGY